LAGTLQRFELTLKKADGSIGHTLASYIPDVVAGEVVGFLASVTDVTPLKLAETSLRAEIASREATQAELQRTSAALAEAQRLGQIGNWEWRFGGEVKWSDEMFRIYGRARESGAPSPAEHARSYGASDRARLDAAIAGMRRTGEPYSIELEIERADGSRGWVEARGVPLRDDGGAVAGLWGTTQDITERRRMLSSLADQHERLRVTLQSIGDAVITTDARGAVEWLNPVAERMTGWIAAEAKGRPLMQVFHVVHQDTRLPADDPVARCLAADATGALADRTLLISRDGREYGIEDSAAPIRSESGAVLGAVLVFHDVSEQRRLSGEMTYRATHDFLTGLANRAEFEVRLKRTLHKALEEHSHHALLYIDLDQFKLVNDACGHAVGDQLLQQVSKLLADAVRARDTLARLGGDEFAIILEHCTTEQAKRIAQTICDRMDDFRFFHADRLFRIGASVGLVPVDDRWSTTAAIQQAADAACYAAKEAGRNRVHAWFDSDAVVRARHDDTQWKSRIERALDEDRLVLFAQRIRALGEAPEGLRVQMLLRMKNDDGSLCLPSVFLPPAERFHLSAGIDRWALRKTIDWMQGLGSLDAIALASVGISGQSIGDRSFHGWTHELLRDAGPEIRRRLCIEVAEPAALANFADAVLFIEQVRSAGVQIALDEFGAGASSFGCLKTLKVDYLKIGEPFIRHLLTDPLDDAAVRCFASVAGVIGVRTIAGSVENVAVMRRLRDLGVDFAQGILIHRPVAIDSLLTEPFSAVA
jgi:diguanylate cyclase (GGDEF)-like protein/PAS domain S-box-containing protein